MNNYKNFYLGLDLGQSMDYTAIAVLEQIKEEVKSMTGAHVTDRINHYHLRHLERPSLGTPYPDIVKRVKDLMGRDPLKDHTTLIVDFTGVGAPVTDLLKSEGLKPVAITITGGNTVHRDGYKYNVPKRDLVSNLQVLFQAKRLKVAEQLPEAQLLIQELLNFKVKINLKTAHDSYEAWREGVHDDLVLAVAMATWFAEKKGPKAKSFRYKPKGW